jgi:hypothetical protein
MSSLSLRDIQGISAFQNKVRIPSGHQLSFDGNLKIPVWTTGTRPVSPEIGLIGYNTTDKIAELYDGTEWVSVGQSKLDGTTADKAVEKSTDILAANPSATTGWYWIKTSGVARQYWVDTTYDGGGWVLVGSHPINVSIPALTYAQAAESFGGIGSSTYGTGDPKTYSAWVGLNGWNAIATANNAGRNIVYYTAGSQVALGQTGSHARRSRWKWNGWNSLYSWNNANSLVNEVGGTTPGFWSYHIVNNYNFTTIDRDQDVYSSNCASLYGNSPWWYGACWDGNFWGGNGSSGHANAAYWTGSGGDYYNYGGIYVK